MNFVVIICSAFRPEVLHSTVETVLQQDKLPSQIVLCVAENCHVLEDTLSLDIRVKRVLSPVRGLTAQRNYALSVIAEESPEITVFLDDDVEMESAFFRKVLYLFENQASLIGVSAESLIGKTTTREEALLAIKEILHVPLEPLSVRTIGKNWICHGCNMFFRTSIFKHERFDENLPLYSYAEDYDFSIRAARHGPVGRVKGVGFVHLSHSSGRVSEMRRGYSMVANNFYFLNKKVTHLPLYKAYVRFWLIIVCKETWISFCRALSGLDANEIDYYGRVRGRLMAVGDLILGRCSPNEILNSKRFR